MKYERRVVRLGAQTERKPVTALHCTYANVEMLSVLCFETGADVTDDVNRSSLCLFEDGKLEIENNVSVWS